MNELTRQLIAGGTSFVVLFGIWTSFSAGFTVNNRKSTPLTALWFVSSCACAVCALYTAGIVS